MFRLSVVFFAVLGVVFTNQFGHIYRGGPLQPKPEKFSQVPGCYIKDLDQVIPFGQSAPDRNSCKEYQCGENFYVNVTCGPIFYTSTIHEIVEDKSKPFPDCCQKFKKN